MHSLCEFLHEEAQFTPVPILEGCGAGVCAPGLGTAMREAKRRLSLWGSQVG